MRISQAEDYESGSVILYVEGSLIAEDVQLLENTCHELKDRKVIIDLAGVSFLDEASAALLRQLKQQAGVVYTGCQLYTRQMIEQSA